MPQKDNSKAQREALKKWHGNHFNNIPGDKHDAYVQLALRGTNEAPVPESNFEACARRIYARVIKNCIES